MKLYMCTAVHVYMSRCKPLLSYMSNFTIAAIGCDAKA